MFLGVAKDDGDIIRIFLENDESQIVKNLEANFPIDYYLISSVGPVATLRPVTLKGGPRAAGKATEVAEIQADGNVVGSAEVAKP